MRKPLFESRVVKAASAYAEGTKPSEGSGCLSRLESDLREAFEAGAIWGKRNSFPLTNEEWKVITLKLNSSIKASNPRNEEEICQELLPYLIKEYQRGYIVKRLLYVDGELHIQVILEKDPSIKFDFELMPLLRKLEEAQKLESKRLSEISETNIKMQQDIVSLASWVSRQGKVPGEIKKIVKSRLKEIGEKASPLDRI